MWSRLHADQHEPDIISSDGDGRRDTDDVEEAVMWLRRCPLHELAFVLMYSCDDMVGSAV